MKHHDPHQISFKYTFKDIFTNTPEHVDDLILHELEEEVWAQIGARRRLAGELENLPGANLCNCLA